MSAMVLDKTIINKISDHIIMH